MQKATVKTIAVSNVAKSRNRNALLRIQLFYVGISRRLTALALYNEL